MFGNIKKGTIFVADHGYSIVCNQFYQVVEVTPSGKSVKIVEIDKETVSTGAYMTNTEIPVLNNSGFGIAVQSKTITKRLQEWKIPIQKEDGTHEIVPSARIKISEFTNAYVWDGQAVAGGGMD